MFVTVTVTGKERIHFARDQHNDGNYYLQTSEFTSYDAACPQMKLLFRISFLSVP